MDWEPFYSSFRGKDFIPGYEIENRLGGGAFGEVYKARKHSIGKAYAIKFLKMEEAERDVLERELAQVRLFAAIDHPNLVTIEDMGIVLGVPYLIMGYAGENTLARELQGGPLELDRTLSIFMQTCRGVLALHERRLVHFDLKPSNVFLKGGVARVGDYGLARLMAEGSQTLTFRRGTPRYMAPEMVHGHADHRADIYSLGVILFECLTSTLPYPEPCPPTDPGPPRFPKEVPEHLHPVIRRCLRFDPKQRFESVGELVEALASFQPWPEGAPSGNSHPAAWKLELRRGRALRARTEMARRKAAVGFLHGFARFLLVFGGLVLVGALVTALALEIFFDMPVRG